jgi:glucose-6-phosphate isomerase
MLFDLAGAAGLEQKRAAMASGQHINTTGNDSVYIDMCTIVYVRIFMYVCMC